MKKEMLINVLQAEECRIAILEDNVLEELYVERASNESYVGNIYKGRIVNIEPSIQAAFVDFGVGRNGFLHVSDVEPTYWRHLERGANAPRSAAGGTATGTANDHGCRPTSRAWTPKTSRSRPGAGGSSRCEPAGGERLRRRRRAPRRSSPPGRAGGGKGGGRAPGAPRDGRRGGAEGTPPARRLDAAARRRPARRRRGTRASRPPSS
ncbi:MAG: S1 RNA-binding domain-containing protein [Gemmataceae bacterium]